ncbi:hypothetical protein [Williamsia sp. CHRR-6]|uniref:hypothetical protein n=1 Tax=Williamsia sp. CHRR-6 TaxID=2835871 RepID=UPI001BDA312C|nr:hypothetical protein [Williamsia sp. CHRR-6]MBT0566258.1 hypothetical protein [Williamsia sp. CHRR-6]
MAIVPMAVTCLISAACGSDTSGTANTTPSSSVAPSAPASTTIKLPPGIAKDSPQDLNSTKDMTGVVTTVPGTKSIYIDYLPDVCKFIPDSVVTQLGAVSKEKAFNRPRLVLQSCVFGAPDSAFGLIAGVYINNIQELIGNSDNRILNPSLKLTDKITAVLYQDTNLDLPDGRGNENCRVSWGTFYGTADVEARSIPGYRSNPCERVVDAARKIAPYMPTRPAQMRK